MKLRQDISTGSLLLIAVGGMVGSGWLFGPFLAARFAGPAAILSWMIGGFMMGSVAMTLAELSTAYPIAGGLARFVQRSHGIFPGFTIAWILWLAALMVAPIETMGAIEYVSHSIPGLAISTQGHVELTHVGIAVAALLMLLMCGVNYFGVKWFSKTNNVLVSWKLFTPIVVAVVLLVAHCRPLNFTHFQGFMPYGFKGVLAALPAAGVVFSFIGYTPAIQLAAEAKNPQRAIPIAVIGSIIFAIILYVLVQSAFIGALNPVSLAHGWSHLSFKGDVGPVAGLVAGLGLVWLLVCIYADAFISPLGTAYIYTASTSRVVMAMANEGYFPSGLCSLNQHGSPMRAILFNYALGLLFFLPFPGWQAMVSFIVSCFVVAYAVAPLACVALRFNDAITPRPFQVPYCHAYCFLAFFICNAIVYWTGWQTLYKMLITVLIGCAFLCWRTRSSATLTLPRHSVLWMLGYLCGLGGISYLGSFGGIGWLAFGPDMLVLLVFSSVIFYWSWHSANANQASKIP